MTTKKMDTIIDYYVSALNDKSNAGEMNGKKFVIVNGRKYAKVVGTFDGETHTAYCFIDRDNGNMYKAASWNSPAKTVRYTITGVSSAINIADKSDAFGNFLYMQ